MRLILTMLFWILLTPAAAQAASCTTSAQSVSFGSSSSYAVQSGTVPATSGSAGLSCSGAVIVLLSGSYARATVTSARNYMLGGPNGDLIPYKLSANPSGSRGFSQGGTINYFAADLLSLFNPSRFEPAFHATVQADANVAAGTYTDTLTVQWSWSVCHLLNVLGICILGETGSGTSTVTVTLTVQNDCRIVAPSVDFGSAPLAREFVEITQSVLVDCTKNSGYAVHLTSGGNGSARPWRAMRGNGGQTLQYNLYRSDGSTIWDESNPLPSAMPGTGAVLPTHPFVYRARINPDQTTPVAGNYSDTVSVVVSF